MKNKVLIIAGSLITLLIIVSLIGRRMGWIGGVKPIEVEIYQHRAPIWSDIFSHPEASGARGAK